MRIMNRYNVYAAAEAIAKISFGMVDFRIGPGDPAWHLRNLSDYKGPFLLGQASRLTLGDGDVAGSKTHGWARPPAPTLWHRWRRWPSAG